MWIARHGLLLTRTKKVPPQVVRPLRWGVAGGKGRTTKEKELKKSPRTIKLEGGGDAKAAPPPPPPPQLKFLLTRLTV